MTSPIEAGALARERCVACRRDAPAVTGEGDGRGMRRAARIGAFAAAVAIALLAPSGAGACSTCFGAADGPMIDGARMGVWALFGLTVLVQGAFAWFFVTLYRRSRGETCEHG